ncbi:glycine/betaine ABC transporter [Candidatus Aerophobetes bacterium]|uniref:Glycine/betaine ABC transporter n=1 Tax=Aerophobetes bacterium TaxID=2030807 RepID=A0A2A4YCW4_UNCAE|nr:MAG: glycine/betaine ABC transporter [Candidatus Aerophobetes bacterium]
MINLIKNLGPTILLKTWEHIELSLIAILIAVGISFPLALLLTQVRSVKVSERILRGISIIQTIPGLALIAFVIVILHMINKQFYVPTTGFLPGLIILVLYALLPIVSNTYHGIMQVPSSLKDAANAIGMSKKQVLFFVEIPLSFPLIISGVRIAFVCTVGLVTLTSLVGTGGLGELILQGLRSMSISYILAGTIPAALLAVVGDMLLQVFSRSFVKSGYEKNQA